MGSVICMRVKVNICFTSFFLDIYIRGGPNLTPGSRDPDLSGHLGSERWDLDLLDDNPDLDKELNPNEDPDPFYGFAS